MSTLIENFQLPLQTWLNQHWSSATNIRIGEEQSRPEGSGFSATTIILPVTFSRGDQQQTDKIVLRVEPPEEAVYPTQASGLDIEIEIQYRTIKAIREHSDVPVAPLIGYESDPSILGAPFYVMEYIAGEVPIENPNYTVEGFFVDATAAERRQLLENGLKQLAGIHAMDWRTAGLDWLVEGFPDITHTTTRRQVELWEQYANHELMDREFSVLSDAFSWLHDNLPTGGTVGFCWGDARPGNIIWQNFNAACVCDFENAFIGPIEIDLGWWLMFDRFSHEAQGFVRLEGELTRDEQRQFYYDCSGGDLGDMHYYEVFAAARYTAIVVRVMNRLVKRGDLPEDQTLWKENPVADMLTAMMNDIDQ